MFAKLEAWFNAFFLGYAARVSGDLAVGLVPVALALVTVYVAIYGLAVMRGEATEPVGTFAWKMAKVGAILSFALPGLYYSGNVAAAATGLQDGLAVLFRGSGRRRLQLQRSAHSTWPTPQPTNSLRCYGKTPACSGLTWWWPASCSRWARPIFLVLGAFVALLGKLILTFALAIGPLAILCLLFKPTARFFDSWVSFVLSAVVLSWFVFFALGMSLYVSDKVVSGHRHRRRVRRRRTRRSRRPRSRRHLPGRHVPARHRAVPSTITRIEPHWRRVHPDRSPDDQQRGRGDRAWVVAPVRPLPRSGGGGSMGRGGGAAYVAGRAAGAVGSAGGAAASGARAAYQRVAQRGGGSAT